MRTRAKRTGIGVWGDIYWKIEKNPFRIFDGDVSIDTTQPVFLDISDSDPELSYPIDIVDDSESFGQDPVAWWEYRDSEGDPEYHHDDIIKYRCPGLVTDVHGAD